MKYLIDVDERAAEYDNTKATVILALRVMGLKVNSVQPFTEIAQVTPARRDCHNASPTLVPMDAVCRMRQG